MKQFSKTPITVTGYNIGRTLTKVPIAEMVTTTTVRGDSNVHDDDDNDDDNDHGEEEALKHTTQHCQPW